jgi:outer membrane immunogenic protein
MRKFLLSTVALFGLTAGAVAADLPVRSAPPPYVAAVPVFTWTGFYVGVNAGWGWQDNNSGDVFVPAGTFVAPFVGVSGVVSRGGGDDDGFVGGAQIGYNWQFGSFVVGLEADIQGADFGGENVAAFVPTGFPNTFIATTSGSSFDWFGTVRARVGFAIDRLLVYATGGFAYAENGGNNNNCSFVGGVGGAFCNNDDWNTGWALGGGIEWALPVNWFGSSAVTFGLEGLWVSLDQNSNNGFVGTYVTPAGAVTPVFVANTDEDEADFAVFRAKLNFKF